MRVESLRHCLFIMNSSFRLFRDVSFQVSSGKTHDEDGQKLPKLQLCLLGIVLLSLEEEER